jgi:hypothetical protein
MLLLTTAALPTLQRWRAKRNGECLGRLLTPRHYPKAAETEKLGIPWAVDNDGFSRSEWPWRPSDDGEPTDDYEKMLAALAHLHPLFVSVPDVWADAERTWWLWEEWSPLVMRYGLPPALLLQDGFTATDVPWGQVSALFLGGSDEYRHGDDVRRIFRLARQDHPRLHLHVGRVSGSTSIHWAANLGAHSVDGTKYARWRDTHLPSGAAAAASTVELGERERLFPPDEHEEMPDPPHEQAWRTES